MTERRVTPAWLSHLLAVGLLLAALVLSVWFFERLPIEGTSLAIDWTALWPGVRGGTLTYGTGFVSPPWVGLLLLPLGLLSFRASWGLLSIFTLGVLVASVPRHPGRWRTLCGILLLVTSFPSLRHLADGNLEGLVIAGILMTLHGFEQRSPAWLAAGVLVALTKIQENWLLLAVLVVLVLKAWPVRRWLLAGLFMFLVAAPSMLWRGADWLTALRGHVFGGSPVDMSLRAALGRMGAPAWAAVLVWGGVFATAAVYVWRTPGRMAREKAAVLISTSMLLAPYAAGNSFLSVLAVGVIPLFLVRPPWGAALLVLADLPFLAPHDVLFNYQAYYWTALLVVCALVLGWSTRRARRRIGVLGGTFDPPHLGHLRLAEAALTQLGLSKVLWVVTADPPHKQGNHISPVADRVAMVEAAISGEPLYEVSRVDIDRSGPHWAADTAALLARQFPGSELIYLMGGDSLRDLPTWGRPLEFLSHCTLGVLRRPENAIDLAALERDLPGISAKVSFVEASPVPIASNEIRRRIAAGQSVADVVPANVARIIEERRLYR